MKRIITISFFILASTLLLAGCAGWTYLTNDAYEENKEVLLYSLGEHQVLDVRNEIRGQAPLGGGTSFYVWEIQYRRYTGELTIFELDNRGPLDYQLLQHAAEQSVADIHKAVTNIYFPERLEESDGVQVRVNIRSLTPNISDTINSTEETIRLRSITAQELVSYWNVMYDIFVTVDGCEYAADEIKRTKALTRATAKYLPQDQINVRLTVVQNDDLSFEGSYHKQTDTFEIITNEERRAVWEALSRSRWQIIKDVGVNYFTEEELTTPSPFPMRVTINHSFSLREIQDFHSFKEIGREANICLSSVTPQELVAYWDITYSVHVDVTDYEKHSEAFESLLDMVKTLAVYLEQDEVSFSFLVNLVDVRDSLSYRGVYHKQTGSFNLVDYD